MTPHRLHRLVNRRRVGAVIVGVTVLLFVGLCLCYGFRADACAAVTVFPSWLWLLPLLLGAALSGLARGRRAGISLLGLSFVFLLAFVEEPASLLRSVGTAPIRTASRPGTLRVVSLNCGGGLPEAAAEVERWGPDLVLLQEVPQKAEVATIARRLYGANAGVVYGFDTAIIAPGAMALRSAREHRFFVTAEVKLADGTVTQVVSLRLAPPLVRMDLWSPECWRQQRENREARRAEMETLLGALPAWSGEDPLIVGGDFNAPAGDAVPAMLAPRLRDSFREAGRGWGNTGLNDIPVVRIDQVWISRHFGTRGVIASRTRHSDHRLVVCDLALSEHRLE